MLMFLNFYIMFTYLAIIAATTIGGVVVLWRGAFDKKEDGHGSGDSSYERPDWMDNDDLTRSL